MTNSSVQTTVDGYHSESAKVNTGIPQGSPVTNLIFHLSIMPVSFPRIEN
jgi:hypothetical protein